MKEKIPLRYDLATGGDFWRESADSPYVTSGTMARLAEGDDRYLAPPSRYAVFMPHSFRIVKGKWKKIPSDAVVLKEGACE